MKIHHMHNTYDGSPLKCYIKFQYSYSVIPTTAVLIAQLHSLIQNSVPVKNHSDS